MDTIEKELNVRKYVHQRIKMKDPKYQAFKSIHMHEPSGLLTVEWVDQFGEVQRDKFYYRR